MDDIVRGSEQWEATREPLPYEIDEILVKVNPTGWLEDLGFPGCRQLFFSSRRRHTRLVSDWSSDVCSSDLAALEERIMARDQKGASEVYYSLVRDGRPLPEMLREAVRIHAPYTHVPYHERLDDGDRKSVV